MRSICVWLELCRGNALYSCRAFHPSANHRAQHAAAPEPSPKPGTQGLADQRAEQLMGEETKPPTLLSFSEETSVLSVAGNAHLQLLGVQRGKNWLCGSLLRTSCLGSHQKFLPRRPFSFYLRLSTFSFWKGCDSAATPGKMKWAIKSNVLQTPQRCVWISCRLSECVGIPVVWKNGGSCSACSCSLW